MTEAPATQALGKGKEDRDEREGRGERMWGGLTEPGRQRLAELGDAGDGAAAVAVREDGC